MESSDHDRTVFDFSERELFQIFSNVDTDIFKSKPARSVTEKDYYNGINLQLPSQSKLNNKQSSEVNSAIRKYKRKKQKKIASKDIIQGASSDVLLSIITNYEREIDGTGDGPSCPKKPRDGPKQVQTVFVKSKKDFHELSERQRREITKPLVELMDNFIENSEFSLTTNQLLGYLLCRVNSSKIDCSSSAFKF